MIMKNKQIREFKSEINSLRGLSEKKDKHLEEKDSQIRELNKGMKTGNAHVKELQDEVNKYKKKYFDLQNKQNDAKQKIQQLEWDM